MIELGSQNLTHQSVLEWSKEAGHHLKQF